MLNRLNWRFCVSLVVCLTIANYARAKDQPPKLAIPTRDAQDAKMKLVREIFQEDIKAARTPEKKRALAAKLLEEALNTSDDSDGRYVLLKMASEKAAAGGDVDATFKSIDQLVAEYDVDSIAIKAESVVALTGAVRERDDSKALLSQINLLVREAVSLDRYELAKQLSALALVSARKVRDMSAIKQALSQEKEVGTAAKLYLDVGPAIARLKVDPTDRNANAEVGEFLCFAKADWESGLPKLASGSNQELSTLAKRDLAGPSDPGEQVRLADDWWTVSEKQAESKKLNIVKHAQQLYSDALPRLSGLEESRVRKKVGGFEGAQPTPRKLPNGAVVAFDFERRSLNRRGDEQFLKDVTNGGSDGEVRNAMLVSGVHGTAISFRGDGLLKFSDKKLPEGNSARSIAFWIKIDKLTGDEAQFGYGAFHEGDALYTLLFDAPRRDRATGRIYVGNPGGRNEQGGQLSVADGKWHHVAVVYDGKGTVSLFIDGRLDLAFKRSYHTSLPGSAYIGVNVDQGAWLYGAIDDFIIFNRAIGADEIEKIKDAGLSK